MKKAIMMTTAVCLMTACEKPLLPDNGSVNESEWGGVEISFDAADGYGGQTRASVVPFSDVCSRLNVAVFRDGEKMKTVAQKAGDSGFGSVRLQLAEGVYSLVAIGHNCAGSATITSETKVTFPSNKVTDTFAYYGELVVTGDNDAVSCTMTRVVAKMELTMTGALPVGTEQLKFYYLGGSSTFSPQDGYGIVQSKQTEVRDVVSSGVYEIYTMPHSEEDVLTRLTVTALDGGGDALAEAELTDIPVAVNMITQYHGDIFGTGGGSLGNGQYGFFCDAEWGGIIEY